MIITETSIQNDEDMKLRWLKDSTTLVLKMREEGYPLMGYTWFPIIDMYDWLYRIKPGPKEDFSARFGFWNAERQGNACVDLYRKLIADYNK